MPTPANRAKIQLVRGSYANILASIADLLDGELCYAKDQNKLYMVEGSTLTPLAYLADVDISETVQDVIGAAVVGGVGLTAAYNDTTGLTTIDLDDTVVTAGTYGSTSAIPTITVDAQGRITAASTNNISTNLDVSADSGTAQVINLGTETLNISGGIGLSSTTGTNNVTVNLDDTTVTPGNYGSATAIPSITVDAQGRITAASTSSITTSLSVNADSGTAQSIDLGTESLAISGGTGLTTTTGTNSVTVDLDNTAVTLGTYGTASAVGTFTVDQQGRLTAASNVNISILHTAISDWGAISANISTSGTLASTNAADSSSSSTGALVIAGGAGIGGNLNIGGDLTVNGTTTTLNTETLLVEDKNIELAYVATPSDTTANQGGITLKGATDKTIQWLDATDSWTFSEHIDLTSGKAYYIGGTQVLSSTTLGSGVTGSSLTSVGTIGTGTWQGSVIGSTYGGTGVNNGSSTITLGGSLTISGAFATTLTVTGTTNVTLPTTGTLVNSNVTTLSSLSTVGTITSGTWNGTPVGTLYGGTGLASVEKGSVLVANASNVITALDGGGASDGYLFYDAATDTISWITELDGGTY